MKRNRWSSVPVAAAGDSVAVVTVAPVESAIAGKRFTLIEQATGCHAFMAPFSCLFLRGSEAFLYL
jgi:hypothetical protein